MDRKAAARVACAAWLVVACASDARTQNRPPFAPKPVAPNETMPMSCFASEAMFPVARDAAATLVGKTFVFRPGFVEPSVFVRREFRPNEVVESVGTVTRRMPVTYRGAYWCTGQATERCSVLAEASKGTSALAVKDATGRYTRERIKADVAPLFEMRPSMRGNCAFDFVGWLASDNAEWTKRAEDADATPGPQPDAVWAVLDGMGPEKVMTLSLPTDRPRTPAASVAPLAATTCVALDARSAPVNPAVDALLKRAAASGVKQCDMTRAILEGRFVPDWEEFQAVSMSLGNGWASRTAGWNRMFGSIEEIDSVRTFYRGQWMQLTGRDLMYHAFMETVGGFMLWDSMKVDPTIHRTVAEARAYLGVKYEGALNSVDDWLERRNRDPVSLWSYFTPYSGTPRFGDRQPQYETLRRIFTRGLGPSGSRSRLARGTADPFERPSLPFVGNKNHTGRPNLTVCAGGKFDKAFAMVRTYGTTEAWTRNHWVAEGFALLTPGDCIDLHFGENQSASVGYLAVLQGLSGAWITSIYADHPNARAGSDDAFVPVEKWICWPAERTAAHLDPDAVCDDPSRRVRFNLAYSTTGWDSGLTLYLNDEGMEYRVRRRGL
jgi:hypothetical protein